jgi:hypothetical protein
VERRGPPSALGARRLPPFSTVGGATLADRPPRSCSVAQQTNLPRFGATPCARGSWNGLGSSTLWSTGAGGPRRRHPRGRLRNRHDRSKCDCLERSVSSRDGVAGHWGADRLACDRPPVGRPGSEVSLRRAGSRFGSRDVGLRLLSARTESATLRGGSTASEMLAVYCSALQDSFGFPGSGEIQRHERVSRLGPTSRKWVAVLLVSQVGCLTSRRGVARVRRVHWKNSGGLLLRNRRVEGGPSEVRIRS